MRDRSRLRILNCKILKTLWLWPCNSENNPFVFFCLIQRNCKILFNIWIAPEEQCVFLPQTTLAVVLFQQCTFECSSFFVYLVFSHTSTQHLHIFSIIFFCICLSQVRDCKFWGMDYMSFIFLLLTPSLFHIQRPNISIK